MKVLPLSGAAFLLFIRGVKVEQVLALDKAVCAIFLEQDNCKLAFGSSLYRLFFHRREQQGFEELFTV